VLAKNIPNVQNIAFGSKHNGQENAQVDILYFDAFCVGVEIKRGVCAEKERKN